MNKKSKKILHNLFVCGDCAVLALETLKLIKNKNWKIGYFQESGGHCFLIAPGNRYGLDTMGLQMLEDIENNWSDEDAGEYPETYLFDILNSPSEKKDFYKVVADTDIALNTSDEELLEEAQRLAKIANEYI